MSGNERSDRRHGRRPPSLKWDWRHLITVGAVSWAVIELIDGSGSYWVALALIVLAVLAIR